MSAPPKSLVVDMAEKDVRSNLVSIIESMGRIRCESIANLGASDGQKLDYLRMAGELASCVNALVKENKLQDFVKAVGEIVVCDSVLMRYDLLQQDFWNKREPRLGIALEDVCAVLLRDDFTSQSHIYHVFQAVKYLNVNGDRDEVYETILPVNSLLSEGALASPEISSHLIRSLVPDVVNDGAGVRAILDYETFVRSLQQAGALYVDIPAEFYERIKKQFPKTRMLEDNGRKYARIVFEAEESSECVNVFKQMKEYAQLKISAEDSLSRGIINFYSFGKDFLAEIKEKIGVAKSPKPQRKVLASMIIDEEPADNGEKKTQDNWIAYWNKVADGRIFASMGDYYFAFKEIKNKFEQGTESEKREAEVLRDSIQQDFDWQNKRNWLISSTRFSYHKDCVNAKMTSYYSCTQRELAKPIKLVVPEYRRICIAEVVSEPEGLALLQAVLNTQDSAEMLMSVVEFISSKKRSEIYVWTAAKSDRKSISERAAGFLYSYDGFHIYCNLSIGNTGRSRGVLIKPRSGRAQK